MDNRIIPSLPPEQLRAELRRYVYRSVEPSTGATHPLRRSTDKVAGPAPAQPYPPLSFAVLTVNIYE